MKYTEKLLIVLVLVLTGLASLAQDLSNKGKEFWVGYGHHEFMELSSSHSKYNSQQMVI